MRQVSKEQLERRYLRQWACEKKLRLPAWWKKLAPTRGTKFWNAVDAMRREAGVQTWDVGGMTYIIDKLNRSST
jgi:hypothetical protein